MTPEDIKALLDGAAKGPWVAQAEFDVFYVKPGVDQEWSLAECYSQENADLMAAAPDLAKLALRQAEEIADLQRQLAERDAAMQAQARQIMADRMTEATHERG